MSNGTETIQKKLEEKIEDQAVEDLNAADPTGADVSKEKKKKKKKKSKGTPIPEFAFAPTSRLHKGNTPFTRGQTFPPSKLLKESYCDGNYPEGKIYEYIDDNSWRTTSEEKRAQEKLDFDKINDLRQAAEVHRQVRKYVNTLIKPGAKLYDVAEAIEDKIRCLTGSKDYSQGIAFPAGISLNNIAAHYSPNTGDTTVFGEKDVAKIDFGVHVNGHIVDSAYTVHFDSQYDPLVEASYEATWAGVKAAGIDAQLCELGKIIQEVIESYEVTIDGKTHPVVPIRNLHGHTIGNYTIHAGKSVPLVDNHDPTRLEEGDLVAIETFASSGRGYVADSEPNSHYARNQEMPYAPLRLPKAKKVLSTIEHSFGTLPFSRRQLEHAGEEKYLMGLRNLVDTGLVTVYPPLVDTKGSYISQFEHTFLLKPTAKEVFSVGDDY